jgi:hypothetical protein
MDPKAVQDTTRTAGEARDETLDNRGNFGSRVVLKRDCACFEGEQARASAHSYHVL